MQAAEEVKSKHVHQDAGKRSARDKVCCDHFL